MCYPYNYTKLQLYLNHLEKLPQAQKLLKRSILCKSAGGNKYVLIIIFSNFTFIFLQLFQIWYSVDLLTITNFDSSEDAIKARKAIVISGRVHAGETPASYMVKGMIDFLLTSNRPEVPIICDKFVLYIIPMINPDGVVNGNYRCSLAGIDLNRHWADPDKIKHPEAYYLKRFIQKTHGISSSSNNSGNNSRSSGGR